MKVRRASSNAAPAACYTPMQNDPLADVPTALQHALGRQVGKVDFAQRPSYGTRGTQFQAVANCFAMQFANTEHPGTPSKLPMKPFHLYEGTPQNRPRICVSDALPLKVGGCDASCSTATDVDLARLQPSPPRGTARSRCLSVCASSFLRT